MSQLPLCLEQALVEGAHSLGRVDKFLAQMADLFFEHNHLRAKNVSSLAVVCGHLCTSSYLFNEDTPIEATGSGSGSAIF